MPIDRFINITAVVIGFFGSMFLLIGVVRLTPNLIARLSRTYIGYNLMEVKNLASHRANVFSGAALVLIAFILEAVLLVFVREPFRVFNDHWLGAGTAIGLALGVFVVSLIGNWQLAFRIERATKRVLAKQDLERYLKDGRITQNQLNSVERLASSLLGRERREGEKTEEFIRSLIKLTDAKVSPDIEVVA